MGFNNGRPDHINFANRPKHNISTFSNTKSVTKR